MAGLVLIVEDDASMIKLLRDILQAEGYEIIEASNGNEAIERAIKEQPDLITMDLLMPETNGLEATRKLRTDEATRDIPIIAITAAAMKGEDQLAMEAGCDAYISKPFHIDVLLEKVKEMISPNKG